MMNSGEQPSRRSWTWQALGALAMLFAVPVLVGFSFGLIFGVGEYFRQIFFVGASNKLSMYGGFSIALLSFISCSVGQALYMLVTLPRFLKHYCLSLREYCHLPKKEADKLRDGYKR